MAMLRIVFGKRFLNSVRALPNAQQKKFDALLLRLQRNPFDPLLHTKHLTGPLAGLLSFRIARDWRVIFQFIDPNTIQLIVAKHRKDIYQ